MKKIYLLLLLFNGVLNAQETQITITSEGISSPVISVEGKSATDIYNSAKDVVNKMFDTPSKQIKVDEPGKLIRFSGFKKFKGGIGDEGTYNYTCELEFKEGRYKILFYDVFLDKGIKRTYVDLYNKAGELRKMDFYKKLHANFTTMVNEVNDEFKNKLLHNPKTDNW